MRRSALWALVLWAALAPSALAHEGDPNYESLVTAVDGVPGLKAEILNGDDRLLVINDGSQTVIVEGYDSEPYARLRPDGRVEVNQRSEATFLNEDRYADVPLPASVDNDAEPQWKVVARNGRFEFHDHRVHWMAKTDPPQVADRSERTRVTDWTVPVRVADRGAGSIRGTLWWRGDGGGAPVAMFAGLGALTLIGIGLVVVVRGRRRRDDSAGMRETQEAW